MVHVGLDAGGPAGPGAEQNAQAGTDLLGNLPDGGEQLFCRLSPDAAFHGKSLAYHECKDNYLTYPSPP